METELEFDIKEEVDKKFYYYDLGILSHDLPDRNYTEINLCSYRVNVTGQHPFLQYLLLYNNLVNFTKIIKEGDDEELLVCCCLLLASCSLL